MSMNSRDIHRVANHIRNRKAHVRKSCCKYFRHPQISGRIGSGKIIGSLKRSCRYFEINNAENDNTKNFGPFGYFLRLG